MYTLDVPSTVSINFFMSLPLKVEIIGESVCIAVLGKRNNEYFFQNQEFNVSAPMYGNYPIPTKDLTVSSIKSEFIPRLLKDGFLITKDPVFVEGVVL